jgi:hypothetical protein
MSESTSNLQALVALPDNEFVTQLGPELRTELERYVLASSGGASTDSGGTTPSNARTGAGGLDPMADNFQPTGNEFRDQGQLGQMDAMGGDTMLAGGGGGVPVAALKQALPVFLEMQIRAQIEAQPEAQGLTPEQLDAAVASAMSESTSNLQALVALPDNEFVTQLGPEFRTELERYVLASSGETEGSAGTPLPQEGLGAQPQDGPGLESEGPQHEADKKSDRSRDKNNKNRDKKKDKEDGKDKKKHKGDRKDDKDDRKHMGGGVADYLRGIDIPVPEDMDDESVIDVIKKAFGVSPDDGRDDGRDDG